MLATDARPHSRSYARLAGRESGLTATPQQPTWKARALDDSSLIYLTRGIQTAVIHVGCCGWAAARARYVKELAALEVQQTFYEPPRPATLARWRSSVPQNFQFTMKCFQLVTHEANSPTYRRLRRPLERPRAYGSFQDTPEVWAAWQETLAAARLLDARVILLQTPASFTPTSEHRQRLENFVRRAQSRTQRLLAFEPRGPQWNPKLADEICQRLGVLRACDPLAVEPPSPQAQPVAYFRLHGIGGYRYRFTDSDLGRLAAIVRNYAEAWVFFNNITMWEDARRFQALLLQRE